MLFYLHNELIHELAFLVKSPARIALFNSKWTAQKDKITIRYMKYHTYEYGQPRKKIQIFQQIKPILNFKSNRQNLGEQNFALKMSHIIFNT